MVEARTDDVGSVLFVDVDHGEYVEALRAARYRVEVAASALQALERGRSMRPDVLIVPLRMPGMDGSDLAHRIGSAADGSHALAVVILVPSGGGDGSHRRALLAGATFCGVPCDPANLVAMVGRQLARRSHPGDAD